MGAVVPQKWPQWFVINIAIVSEICYNSSEVEVLIIQMAVQNRSSCYSGLR